jgi:hypothetical protein
VEIGKAGVCGKTLGGAAPANPLLDTAPTAPTNAGRDRLNPSVFLCAENMDNAHSRHNVPAGRTVIGPDCFCVFCVRDGGNLDGPLFSARSWFAQSPALTLQNHRPRRLWP